MTSPLAPPPTRRRLPAVPPERSGRWAVVVLWGSLVLTAGPVLAAALDPRSRAVQVVTSLGLWGAWIGALGAALIPRTVTLTAVRIVMPTAVPVMVWALGATRSPTGGLGGVGVEGVLALGTAVAVTVLVLAALVGDGFVNGSAYGEERRLPLRPPAALLLGPVPLAWAACVVGAVTGPLLLAAQAWVAGAVTSIVGWAVAAVTGRALHGLARRWLVFVPAGLVVHDHLAVAEPLLCTRRFLRRLAPALADTDARDLTAGALGLALQVDLTEPLTATPVTLPRRRGAKVEATGLTSFLVAPSRPGAVLREARRRRMPVD